jgi:drug/metabolite transporter (DMT)-like permease
VSRPTEKPVEGGFAPPVVVLAILVLLTVSDGILQFVLFDKYPDTYALFLNQGTAFVYILVSSSLLVARRIGRKQCNHTLPTPPWYVLVAIGMFNGLANFCQVRVCARVASDSSGTLGRGHSRLRLQAIGNPHTASLTQSLLNLLGVPLVLALSFVFLRKRPSWCAMAGAALIVLGCGFSALRALVGADSPSPTSSPTAASTMVPTAAPSQGPNPVYWYSTLIFLASQFFLGGEKVFEEHTFARYQVDVMVMFHWTLCTQFILGFALVPDACTILRKHSPTD